MKKTTSLNHIVLILIFMLNLGVSLSQEGIGTSNPNKDAALDISSSNKGLLMPRIELTSTTSFAPLTAHVVGMIVYNTATAGTAPNNVTPGYYYNDGATWVRIANTTSVDQTNDLWVNNGANVIAPTGSVGIGTDSPISRVHISDGDYPTVNFGNNALLGIQGRRNALGWESTLSYNDVGYLDIKSAYTTASNGEGRLQFYRTRGTIASPESVVNGDLLGSVQFRGFTGGANYSSGVRLTAYMDDASITSSGLSTTSFSISKVSLINGNKVNHTPLHIDRFSNVGIGTPSPSEKLDVQGKVRVRTRDNAAEGDKVLSAHANGVVTETSVTAKQIVEVVNTIIDTVFESKISVTQAAPILNVSNIYGNTVQLEAGMYFVDIYNLLKDATTASNIYYAVIDIEAVSGGSVKSPTPIVCAANDFSDTPYSFGNFYISVIPNASSNKVSVRLKLSHGAGGTFSISPNGSPTTRSLAARIIKIK